MFSQPDFQLCINQIVMFSLNLSSLQEVCEIYSSAARGEGDMEEELPNFPSSASLDSSTSVGR